MYLFICYRRKDVGSRTQQFHDRFSNRLDVNSVFMDFENREAGQEFPERIQKAVEGSSIDAIKDKHSVAMRGRLEREIIYYLT